MKTRIQSRDQTHGMFACALSLLFCCLSLALVRAASISTFAGTGTKAFSGDGGPALRAQLNDPAGIARGGDGSLYICDTANHRIRKVTPDGKITTVAGTGEAGWSGDSGPATVAKLNEPYEFGLMRPEICFGLSGSVTRAQA